MGSNNVTRLHAATPSLPPRNSTHLQHCLSQPSLTCCSACRLLTCRFWEVGGNNVIRLQRAAALASTMLVEQCEAAFQLMNNRTRAGSSGNGAAQDVGRPRNGKP